MSSAVDDIGGAVSDVGSMATLGLGGDIPTLNELSGKEAAKQAAREQRNASEANIALQREMMDEQRRQYDLMRSDYAPFREAGAAQLPMLQQMAQAGMPEPTMAGFSQSPEAQIGNMEDFRADPGYQFQLQEGMGAIQNAAAAGGSLESGRTLKELQRFGQGLADQTYGNWYNRRAGEFGSFANRLGAQSGDQFNRLASLAGIGQTATGGMSSLGQNQLAMQQQGMGNIMGQNQAMANANAATAMQGYQGMGNLLGQGLQAGGMLAALSDEREKEDIEDSTLGLDFVSKLRPVRWKYKGKKGSHDGLIAQELKKAMEEAGVDGEMHVDGERQGIRYGELIGPIIKAIQELDAKVEAKNG